MLEIVLLFAIDVFSVQEIFAYQQVYFRYLGIAYSSLQQTANVHSCINSRSCRPYQKRF